MQVTRVNSLPECDLCADGTEARYDAQLRPPRRSWGHLCEDHFEVHGSPRGATKLEAIKDPRCVPPI